MEKLHILLLEDQSLVAVDIIDMIERMGHEVVSHVDNGPDAIQSAQTKRPDLAVLDIKVKGSMNGIEVGRRVREELHIPVIYLTSMGEVYELARDTNPYAFLNKPVSAPQLRQSIELAVQAFQAESPVSGPIDHAIYIRHNDRRVRVALKDILMLKADGGYCYIFSGEDKMIIAKPMGKVLDELQRFQGGDRLMQVHRSCCVHLDHVSHIQGNMLRVGSAMVDIGETYRERVLAQFPSI